MHVAEICSLYLYRVYIYTCITFSLCSVTVSRPSCTCEWPAVKWKLWIGGCLNIMHATKLHFYFYRLQVCFRIFLWKLLTQNSNVSNVPENWFADIRMFLCQGPLVFETGCGYQAAPFYFNIHSNGTVFLQNPLISDSAISYVVCASFLLLWACECCLLMTYNWLIPHIYMNKTLIMYQVPWTLSHFWQKLHY